MYLTSPYPPDKPNEIALEELRQLEAAIGRFDQLEFQLRAWLFVLLVGLVAGLLSERSKLTKADFRALAPAIVGLFSLVELVHRIPKRKAIYRVNKVERALRGEIKYDGPKIGASLTTRWARTKTLKLVRAEVLTVAPFWGFYVAVISVCLLIAWLVQ